MYILGFDYGHKKIGVAIGQTISQTASPLTTIQNKNGSPWAAIESIIQEWKPKNIIIGLPINTDGQEQPITIAARQFSKTLENKFKKKYGITFHFHDERYTSQAAQSLYNKHHDNKHRINQSKKQQEKAQKWSRDAIAAVLILEAWFEIRHAKERDRNNFPI